MIYTKGIEYERIMRKEVWDMRKTGRRICGSRELARRFLLSTGVYTEAGKLKESYGGK